MVNSADLQNAYVKLYACLRNYIWDFRVVQLIANLEVAVYTRIPDLVEVRRYLDSLKLETRDVCQEDEELSSAFDKMYDILGENTEVFSKIYVVTEVVQK